MLKGMDKWSQLWVAHVPGGDHLVLFLTPEKGHHPREMVPRAEGEETGSKEDGNRWIRLST